MRAQPYVLRLRPPCSGGATGITNPPGGFAHPLRPATVGFNLGRPGANTGQYRSREKRTLRKRYYRRQGTHLPNASTLRGRTGKPSVKQKRRPEITSKRQSERF